MTKAEEVFRIKLPNGFEYFKTFVDEAGDAESYETGLFIPDLTAAEAREFLTPIIDAENAVTAEEVCRILTDVGIADKARALLAKLPEEE